jgi:hypothetical protein
LIYRHNWSYADTAADGWWKKPSVSRSSSSILIVLALLLSPLKLTAMNYPNLISTCISNKQIKEILDAIRFVDKKLPELITVSDLEQSALYKTKYDTVAFVLENLKIATKHPEIVPENVDVEEIRKDVELIKSIDKILKPLKVLIRKLEDSQLVAGSEAYLPSIAIYNAYKAKSILKKHDSRSSINA